MIPTSIDGTDITGATIDGTDVQEITVDGQTVFSAGPTLPVAYSNLVAWYPFDSATYGGSNADDVTAIIGGSGDDTAFDGTVISGTYDSNGGITDIRAGPNSGAYEFDGNSGNGINCGNPLDSTQPFTTCVWFFLFSNGPDWRILNTNDDNNGFRIAYFGGNDVFHDIEDNNNNSFFNTSVPNTNVWIHWAHTFDGSTFTLYENGSFVNSINANPSGGDPIDFHISGKGFAGGTRIDGYVDDVRVYNTSLSATQINQIYQNTEP